MSDSYHATRLAWDSRRTVVWNALWKYFFRHRVKKTDCVLDIGCGYGDFINSVRARRKLAVDTWQGSADHLSSDVEFHAGHAWELDWIADRSVDLAFASNIFEHLTRTELTATLRALEPKIAPGGRIVILQPNYRYAYREYFDDFTHVSVFSHVSLADFLSAEGWRVTDVRPRFLPLSVKSKMPVVPVLIGVYLASPVKPFAKQMLVTAEPPSNE